jgi:hypothetical protein
VSNDKQAMRPFEGASGRLIRRQWHDGGWFFSVVDVVAVLTEAQTPRNYWSDLKRRLGRDEGFTELHAKIVRLNPPGVCGNFHRSGRRRGPPRRSAESASAARKTSWISLASILGSGSPCFAPLDAGPLEVVDGAGEFTCLLAETGDSAKGLVPIREVSAQFIHYAVQPLEVVGRFHWVAPKRPMRRTLRSIVAKANMTR